MAVAGPVRAFLSYAHEDHRWREAVLAQLGFLTNSNQLEIFSDPQISSGELWDGRIKTELQSAEIVLFLISGNFLRSSYCIKNELLPSLDRYSHGLCSVVPILCEYIDLAGTPFGPLQCLPHDPATNNLKPLKDWRGRTDLALAPVVAKVRELIKVRRSAPAGPSGKAPLLADVTSTRAPPRSAHLPPCGRFLGRATDLEKLRSWVLDRDCRPIVLLGPGGVGKSKLTVAALRDPAVAAQFGEHRYFVRLHDVRDEAGIYAAVAREIGIEPGHRPFESLVAKLEGEPTLIALDNAEAPWELDLDGAEQAFARLDELSATTVVASVRGFEQPGIVDWREIEVEPLPPDFARALFIAIAGERYTKDSSLPMLLARLDGLPLAIELVAHRARAEPDAATVLSQWDAERSRYPARRGGGSKDHDLAASVALSLNSTRMSPGGRRLFALLGRLPSGLRRADLLKVLPSDNLAAATLRDTGLVFGDPVRLRMLAPIRGLAAAEPLGDVEQDRLCAHFSGVADKLPYQGEEPTNWEVALEARKELENIEATLALTSQTFDADSLGELGWRWIKVGDTHKTVGALRRAAEAYRAAQRQFEQAVNRSSLSTYLQRDLTASLNRQGDVLLEQGDLHRALVAYLDSKDIRQKLVKMYPSNLDWQRDLSVSWNKLGDLYQEQKNLSGAFEAYSSAKNIREQLAAADEYNLEYQRDLSVSWIKLGEVWREQGDLAQAMMAFNRGKNIRVSLAKADEGNITAQRDLATSLAKLGIVYQDQRDLDKALQVFNIVLSIVRKLVTVDSNSAMLRYDFYATLWQLGNIKYALGSINDALADLHAGYAIIHQLSVADPANVEWQRDLIMSHNRLRDLEQL